MELLLLIHDAVKRMTCYTAQYWAGTFSGRWRWGAMDDSPS